MKEHHLSLVQAEIDGLNSESDSERLRSLLAGDEELQAAFEELHSVKLAIESLSELDPPASLKASIMAAIPHPEPVAAPSTARAPWWSGIVDMVRLPKPVTLAYAFSLGLIVAFVVTTVLGPSANGNFMDPVSGTMISTDMAGYELLEEYEIGEEEEEKEGTVRVFGNEAQIIIEFVWNSREPVQARVYFEEEWMGITGTRHIRKPDDFKTTTTDKEVELSGSGPVTEYVSIGRRDVEDEEEAELNFEVRSRAKSLLKRSLRLRRNY